MISVIIPVYNVSSYLRRCIESVIAQKNQDWELLLIDDGSTDGSDAICDEYANEQIKVFHTENKGVSHARNVGLNHAKGEWIAFIDADDWVDPDFLSIQPSDKTDVIEKPSIRHHYNDEDEICNIPDTYQDITDKDQFYFRYVHERNNAIWDKVIRSSIIGENRFNEEVKKGEDLQFFLSIISRIKVYSYSKNGYYHYYQRKDSAMAYYNANIREDIMSRIRNMNNIRSLLHEGAKEQALANCIINYSYLPSIYEWRSFLTKKERIKIQKAYFHVFFHKLSYLTIKEHLFLYKHVIKALANLILNR